MQGQEAREGAEGREARHTVDARGLVFEALQHAVVDHPDAQGRAHTQAVPQLQELEADGVLLAVRVGLQLADGLLHVSLAEDARVEALELLEVLLRQLPLVEVVAPHHTAVSRFRSRGAAAPLPLAPLPLLLRRRSRCWSFSSSISPLPPPSSSSSPASRDESRLNSGCGGSSRSAGGRAGGAGAGG